MKQRSFWFGTCFLVGCLSVMVGSFASFGVAGGKEKDKAGGKDKPGGKGDLTNIHLEVAALRTIDSLDLSETQLALLATLAKETSEAARARKQPKVSVEYRKTLLALHAALKKNEIEEADEIQEKLDALSEKEEPEFDDEVAVTEAARNKVTEFLRHLRVTQITSYVNQIEITDPIELIEDAINESQEQQGKDWTDTRDEAADRASQLLGGINAKKTGDVRQKVIKLLNKAHQMKPGDFAKAHKALNEEALDIAGKMTPFEILRTQVAWNLAEFLSNPRAGKAAEIRLANQK